MQLQCPLCHKLLEQKSYRGGIHVDECLWCKGVWFDAGELETYRTAIAKRESDVAAVFEPVKERGDKLGCPSCREETLIKGTIRNIQVHRCDKCHGIYVSGEQIAELNYDTRPNSPVIDALFMLRILSLIR
jgi:Zn-finger nucleic acid-binding protein